MEWHELNPYVRFAAQIKYKSQDNPVYGMDSRLFYIVSGTAELFMEKQHFSLAPGALFYCHAKQVYNIKTTEGISLLALNFSLTQKAHRQKTPYAPVPWDGTQPVSVHGDAEGEGLQRFLFFANGAQFFPAVSSIVEEFSAHRLYRDEKCSAVLKNLLIDLLRAKQSVCESAAEAVRFATDYLKAHFQEPCDNKRIAKLTGYHEYYLNRLFLQHTGMGMHKYLLHLRLNEAKRLLLNTNLPQAQIAEQVGFGSAAHFSSYFKKETNMTPSAFRTAFRNQI